MKKLGDMALGILTSVGGFLEIGSLVTSAQAGARFGFQLVWAVLLGGLCLVFLVEMSGRFAAVSKHTIPDAIRERFGFTFFLAPLLALVGVGVMVLAAELGGIAIAAELATGVDRRVWVLPAALLTWLLLWKGTFAVIEKGVAMLSLITIGFVVAAVAAHPRWKEVAGGVVPSAPDHDKAGYWFLAVAILGASISPYLFFFYSSGAIEEKWNRGHLGMNRAVSGVGLGFGTAIAASVLVLAGVVLRRAGLRVEDYRELPRLLTDLWGRWGFWLFVASLGIACLGAALETALAKSYIVAQGFGWNWGEDQRPLEDARFSFTYSAFILAGAVLLLCGVDVLKLTNLAMALTAVSLPLCIAPFLLLMNDRRYLAEHRNGWVSNLVVAAVVGLALVLALVTIPLEIVGG